VVEGGLVVDRAVVDVHGREEHPPRVAGRERQRHRRQALDLPPQPAPPAGAGGGQLHHREAVAALRGQRRDHRRRQAEPRVEPVEVGAGRHERRDELADLVDPEPRARRRRGEERQPALGRGQHEPRERALDVGEESPVAGQVDEPHGVLRGAGRHRQRQHHRQRLARREVHAVGEPLPIAVDAAEDLGAAHERDRRLKQHTPR
jgi:hypothetical protein